MRPKNGRRTCEMTSAGLDPCCSKSKAIPFFDFFRLGIVNVFKVSISNSTSSASVLVVIVQTQHDSHYNIKTFLPPLFTSFTLPTSRQKVSNYIVQIVRPMSHLRFYRAILSRNFIARQNRKCDMVRLSSVTFVHLTQPVEILRISSPFGTLAIR